MRREINILWIEDNLNTAIQELQEEVTKIIENALYKVNIYHKTEMQCIDFKNKKCALCPSNSDCCRNILRDKRIDIIFSDNNLDNGSEGVDFLTEYRSKGEYKYYILYSNLDETSIVEKIIDRLKSNRKIHLFSNFDFFSLNNWEERIDDSIAAFINNRSKMEKLSNIYIVENALIEDRLKEKAYDGNYYEQINLYCEQEHIEGSLKSLWHQVRIDRNTLAHGAITFTNGYNIATLDHKHVSEEEYDKKMQNLKTLTEKLANHDSDFQY